MDHGVADAILGIPLQEKNTYDDTKSKLTMPESPILSISFIPCRWPPLYHGNVVVSAVCSPPCENGGACTMPGVCDCLTGFFGYRCEDAASAVTAAKKFCYYNQM